ncbi:MAG: hypothetical protein BHW64_06765 [Candidatus Melainabacteria bacterium LEY3_CP_29_8]|nr:MAG: hypothetical protein BHW64_06765 [Candidatus Melainabacteria bacterium LEY3_CP_29_8]
MLSEGYVGINGLFTDILNILSLSELGVGTAITYALYRPIAENDISKQQILMRNQTGVCLSGLFFNKEKLAKLYKKMFN